MESRQIHFRIHPVHLLKPRYLLLEQEKKKETEFYRCALLLNHQSRITNFDPEFVCDGKDDSSSGEENTETQQSFVERKHQFPGMELIVREFSFHQLNANLLWPGTFAFAEWLIQNRPLIEGQHCIELGRWPLCSQIQSSGVDNSGKTRIVLTINGEDTGLVTPTIVFNINTLTYQNSNFNGETRGIRKC